MSMDPNQEREDDEPQKTDEDDLEWEKVEEKEEELPTTEAGETCATIEEEKINFQEQRENLTWEAGLKYLEDYVETEDDVVSTKEKEMYARQALLKGWNQRLLKKSKIMVVGLGMVGRELAKDLALIGVGSITMVDPQVIGEFDKPKFLMPGGEGARPKVEIIKDSLKKLNPFMEIQTIDKSIEDIPLNEMIEHDIIVGCMNNFKSRVYVYEACKRFKIPFLEGICMGLEGFIQAWLPEDPDDEDGDFFSSAYADEIDKGMGENNAAVASIIAGVLGQEIIKVAFKVHDGDIGDVQKPRFIKFDGTNGLFDPYAEQKDLLLVKGKDYRLNRDLLKKSTVFIAGVGALGCEIAKDLALAGVGKLILVDLDTIETSNLSRQLLFRLEDIGKPKAEVGGTRVKELNPDIEVEHYFTKIQDLPMDLYENSDVIIAALDNVKARFDLNVIARQVKKPMIEGGTVGFEGHVQVIVPEGAKSMEETACYRCVVPIPPPDNKLIAACTPKGIPQNREHCVLRAEFIYRKKKEKEPDMENKEDLILLTGASNKELSMLKEREPDKDHGGPFILQDMENILKNKIPAIQTVSSVIASIESLEALKMACIQQSSEKPKNISVVEPTYMNYNGIWGIIDHLPVLKREDCPVCGTQKGIEYFQIPINDESTIEDIFMSLQKIGVDIQGTNFMVTNPISKAFIYHKSVPSYSNLQKKLGEVGLKPGDSVLLTPYGAGKVEGEDEPMKYQITLISVN
ncbi:MAG: ThiF family adenylyltransferase [Candidatus Hodarchaeota archaeon]